MGKRQWSSVQEPLLRTQTCSTLGKARTKPLSGAPRTPSPFVFAFLSPCITPAPTEHATLFTSCLQRVFWLPGGSVACLWSGNLSHAHCLYPLSALQALQTHPGLSGEHLTQCFLPATGWLGPSLPLLSPVTEDPYTQNSIQNHFFRGTGNSKGLP